MDSANRLGKFSHVLRWPAPEDREGRNICLGRYHCVVEYLDVVFYHDAVPNHTVFPNVHITADGLGADDAVRLDRHIVSDVHLDVLDLTMLLVEGGSDDDVLFDDHVGAEVDRGHVSSHDHLRMHHILPFHSDVLQALQDDILRNLVLLLRE